MSVSNLFVLALSDNEILAYLQKILLTLVYTIDGVIYKFIPEVYNLFSTIAETELFGSDIIQEFGTRIYTLLGIFMLFKVSFSFINYIINPDSFLDKEKGVSKIATNAVIVLVLLVITPTIFSEAMDLQHIILKDDTIGTLIFGINGTDSNFKRDAGESVAYTTFTAFYRINPALGCDDPAVACSGVPDVVTNNFRLAKQGPAVSMLFRDVSVLWLTTEVEGNTVQVISYSIIISTIVGAAILLILATFCFDVAVRTVKLGFLQLIAPIPIISRIDPKSSKDGLFSKWLKTCIKTYLDIFIRLLAIYFAVFIISIIAENGIAGNTNIFVKVFIIFGALLFAKQLPQFINDLGFKLDAKDFTINPLKKLATVPVAGAATAAAVGGVDSLVHGNGFWHGVRNNWRESDWKGDAKKNYMLDTYDSRLRREVNKKADPSQGRYEARRQSNERDKQIARGNELRDEKVKIKIKDNSGNKIKIKDKLTDAIDKSKDIAAVNAGYANYKDWKKADDMNNKTNAVRFDAETTAKALFKNKEFRDSYVNLAVKKQEMYNAKNIAAKAQNDHSAATVQYNQLLSTLGAANSQTIAAKTAMDTAYDALIDANAKVGKTTSVFNMTEAKHKDLQKIHVSDAQVEVDWDVSGKLK